MAAKLSYFDLLMYVVPGGMLQLALLFAWSVSGLTSPPLFGSGGLFESVAFLLVAFLLGHFVQAVAHVLVQGTLKRAFWAGRLPSEIVFFRAHGLLSEPERRAILDALTSDGTFDIDALELFDGAGLVGQARGAFERAMALSQLAFNRARRALQTTDAGRRIEVTEAYYQFFRGACAAALLAAAALGIACYAAAAGLAPAPLHHAALGTGLVAAASVVVAAIFFFRARGAAVNFVREVYRAKDALRSGVPGARPAPAPPPLPRVTPEREAEGPMSPGPAAPGAENGRGAPRPTA